MSHDLLLPHLGRDPTELAVRAEELGYRSAWIGELWGSASPVKLTEIACRTDDLELGSAVLNVYSRSPAVLAMTAYTIDRVSEGRFTLGVGTSTAKAVEDLHGMPFDRPVRRAHETIELVRAFLEGSGRVDYDGELLSAADFPSLGHGVPIYHAALGEANRRVVARLCDGWIPHNVPFPDLQEAFDYVVDNLPADRDPGDVTVAPYVPAAVSDDPEEARDAVRGHVAYYVGNGEGYKRAVGRRFPEAADRIQELWQAGDRPEATAAVTDEMVAALGVAGTPDGAREQFRALLAMDVVDRPMVTIPNNAAGQLGERTIEALAPDRL